MSHPIDREALARRILAVIERSPGVTNENLRREIGGKDAIFREVLGHLEVLGAVRQESLRARGNPIGYYPTTVGSAGRAALDELSRLAQTQGLYPSVKSGDSVKRDTEPAPPPETIPQRFADLVAAVRTGAKTLEELCDRLDMAPAKARGLLEDAREAGISLQVAHDHIGLAHPDEDLTTVHDANILPVVGDEYAVGAFSDTHYGSKYCLRHQIVDYIHWATEKHGVKTFLHVGDWTQGIYTKHSVFEVTANSQEDQLLEMAEWLPRGPQYIGIAGNHDEEWVNRTGLPFKRALRDVWRDAGRDDITIVGSMGAFVRLGGAVIYLWHGGGPAYSLSYHLQNKAQEFASVKPHILLQGHVHQSCKLETRGIECIMVPCFQGGNAPFSKKQRRAPALGGLVLKWRMHTGGAIRDFEAPKRRYYELEGIFDAHNPVAGTPIDPVEMRATVPGAPESSRRQWHSCTGRAA